MKRALNSLLSVGFDDRLRVLADIRNLAAEVEETVVKTHARGREDLKSIVWFCEILSRPGFGPDTLESQHLEWPHVLLDAMRGKCLGPAN